MQRYAEESLAMHLRENLQPLFDRRIGSLKNPPFSNNMTAAEIDEIIERAMRQTERFRVLREAGKTSAEIKVEFSKPVEMSLFSWKGEIDTIMSPIDSIKWYLRFFRSSFMAMENGSGMVKAYVGGPSYEHFMYDMVKGGKRQVGSTVKPFLYTLAMQNGFTPCTKVPYVRQQFVLWDGTIWEPRDASIDDEYFGQMVTLKWGLANSKNMISAWVMKQFNPQAVTEVMKKLGVYSYIDPVPSMFLGTSDITLYEMVGAFSTYANKGVYVKPWFVTHIEDRHGNLVANFVPQRYEALDENTAFLMLNLMQGVVDGGTGGRLRSRDGIWPVQNAHCRKNRNNTKPLRRLVCWVNPAAYSWCVDGSRPSKHSFYRHCFGSGSQYGIADMGLLYEKSSGRSDSWELPKMCFLKGQQISTLI
jgi:penicillin-binding protein 1A